MAAVILNVLIGMVTSVISGGSIWLWQQGRNNRLLHRKAAFFGLGRGVECLIVMNDKYSKPGTTAQHDVHAMIDIATLAAELDSPISVTKGADFRGHNGDSTEFCIGGPARGSNPRTGGHLAAHLPGVKLRPYSSDEDSLAFMVGERRFLCDRRNREHVLIAKFTPRGSTRPVIVLCGQTSVGNRAGIAFLKREYRTLAKTLASTSRFCIMVRVDSIATFGHEATSLAADVTTEAFEPAERAAAAG
ncbi:hypothetical protein FXF68_13225 [Actinomadura decatromicini]|uniref:Uncharacterized protein n=1 Tax=Actinomadura decatromicini TaxID=2604572 RepID=A0A5D3FUL2_9ACTN|nr:hypothetical protein FXF68_13225 [Actinomadura decatromicini]